MREYLDGQETSRLAQQESLLTSPHAPASGRTIRLMDQPSENALSPIRIHEPLCAVFRRRLKAEGQKYTPERAQILDAIIKLDDVFEAEQLRDELKQSGFRVSKATVYRTLKLLQDAGIIQQVLLDAEQARYQLIYGQTPRDLLIRVDTNDVISIDAPELTEMCERICAEHGLALQGRRFHIFATGE